MALDGGWGRDVERWLEPFLAALSHPARRRMCPIYVAGLIGPGDRRSVQPMAARAGAAGYDRLRHFVAAGVWDAEPLEAALLAEADRLVGGKDAFLVVDDTALPKKGRHSVGVAPQYATVLGKNANCQTLVSLTLARREVPVGCCHTNANSSQLGQVRRSSFGAERPPPGESGGASGLVGGPRREAPVCVEVDMHGPMNGSELLE